VYISGSRKHCPEPWFPQLTAAEKSPLSSRGSAEIQLPQPIFQLDFLLHALAIQLYDLAPQLGRLSCQLFEALAESLA
jgi:hypothetical protein